MTPGVLTVGVVVLTMIMPSVPTPAGSAFIEARLCASGQIVRIALPGQKEPEKHAPMPCHAVCARGNDGGIKDLQRRPKD